MARNKTTAVAEKFAAKLKYDITFDSIAVALKDISYSVILWNTDKGDELLRKYNLTSTAKEKKAFTYSSETVKIVFVDSTLPSDSKILCLLHEAGHVLQHFPLKNKSAEYMEIEADTFAYTVLNTKKPQSRYIIIALAVLLSVASCAFTWAVFVINSTEHEGNTKSVLTSLKTSDTVYINPSGTKYHISGCRYITEKSFAVNLQEAQKEYTPCKVCIK